MRLNIGVIFGGKSVEHEISILTATEIMGYIDQNKYKIVPIYIDKDNIWYYGDHLKDIINYRDIDLVKRYAKRVALINTGHGFALQTLGFIKRNIVPVDLILPCGHGTFMEDGSLQGYLNMLGIPYVGCGVAASAFGQDKVFMKQLLEYNNIATPNYIWFYGRDYLNNKKTILNEISKFKYPMYVKPASLGSSIGISRVNDENELNKAIKEAILYDKKIIVEEAIKNVKEVNISVLGDSFKQEVSGVEEINTSDGFYSFKEKYVEGCNKLTNRKKNKPIVSKEMIEDMKDLAIKTFKIINASGVARIDFLVDEKNMKVYVNEINTIPGSLSGWLWVEKGKKQTDLIDDLINIAIKRYKEKDNITLAIKGNLLEKYDLLKGEKIKNKKTKNIK